MPGIIESLLPAIDSILGVRDSIGAVIKPVYLVTRRWYTDEQRTIQATEIGGYALDIEEQMLPSPQLVNLGQKNRVREGGTYQDGDILLKNVSKNSYDESDLDGSSTAANVEKFYRVGEQIFQVIGITPKYVTWDVALRPLTDQSRYPDT